MDQNLIFALHYFARFKLVLASYRTHTHRRTSTRITLTNARAQPRKEEKKNLFELVTGRKCKIKQAEALPLFRIERVKCPGDACVRVGVRACVRAHAHARERGEPLSRTERAPLLARPSPPLRAPASH